MGEAVSARRDILLPPAGLVVAPPPRPAPPAGHAWEEVSLIPPFTTLRRCTVCGREEFHARMLGQEYMVRVVTWGEAGAHG